MAKICITYSWFYKVLLTIIVLFVFHTICDKVYGQKILLLEKAGSFKNYKYQVNDYIILKVKYQDKIIKGTINKLTDTSMIVNYGMEIKFRDVTDIYREMWAKKWVPELLIKASIGYFLVVGINDIIQKDYPVIPKDVLVTTAILAGSGFILSRIFVKHYKLDNSWRIRLFDFNKLSL